MKNRILVSVLAPLLSISSCGRDASKSEGEDPSIHERSEIMEVYWDPQVRQCGDSYFGYASPLVQGFGVSYPSGSIAQFRGVGFLEYVEPLSEADRLNKIEWAADVVMKYTAMRVWTRSKGWDGWEDPPVPGITEYNTYVKKKLVKQDGEWYVAPSWYGDRDEELTTWLSRRYPKPIECTDVPEGA